MFVITAFICCLLCCGAQGTPSLQAQGSQSQNDALINSNPLTNGEQNISSLGNINSSPSEPGIDCKASTGENKQASCEQRPNFRRAASASLGYELSDNWLGYYKIHNDKQTWQNAKQACAEENTNLLVINSQQELAAVHTLLNKRRTSNKYFWIGFHDLYEEGNYVTIFNESLNSTGFEVWGFEEPDRRTGENCGVLGSFQEYDGTYSLGDWMCNSLLPYICEEQALSSSTTQEKPSLEGYELVPYLGHYKKHSNYSTWQEAVDTCHQEGGHLIILDSDIEKDKVSDLYYRGGWLTCFWTGVHYTERGYVTILNNPTQVNWWPLRLPLENGKDCLDYCFGSNQQGSSGVNCNQTRTFICELEI